MKYSRIAALLGLGLMTVTVAPENADAAARSYKMLCKGKFKVEMVKSHMVIRFSKAPSGSSNGASLQNGQCAWSDRGLNSSEPPAINFSKSMAASVPPAIISCARESGCVMGFYALKSGNSLWADSGRSLWLLP
ncbi:MAG: hypothetical protein ACRBN8_43505 [Nannocystales bacterium]